VALRLEPRLAKPLWARAQRRIVGQHPYTWLYYDHLVVAMSPHLHGVILDSRDWFYNPQDWWLSR